MVPINYLAVLVSTLVMMVLGALWYGPLFGKQWIALMGFDPEKVREAQEAGMKSMWRSYALMALGALCMSFVLSHTLIFASTYLHSEGIAAGIQVGFWTWLGFIAPVTLGSVIWEGKPWTLWAINAGYYLTGLLAIGVLLALWV